MKPIDGVNYVIVFLPQTTKRYLTFLLASLIVTLTALLLWIYFFSQTLVFVLQWPSLVFVLQWPLLGNSDHVVVSASIDFTWNSNDHFHRPAYDYSRADLDGPLDNSKGFSWEGIFKLGASDNTIEFCELVQVEIDVYIPQRKY